MTALYGVDHPTPYDPDDLDDPQNQRQALQYRRAKDGAAFILDAPEEIPAIWGNGQEVLWARGESLIIVGPPGVGKTTLASQIIRARLGIGRPVLGLPIEKGTRRVLYLAMDRPAQIARALRRSFTEHDRAVLAEQLVVWAGPPPSDLAKNPTELAGLAQTFDADTVIIDSLKDAFLGLSNDEEAAGYNRARQYALAEGVELIELHHQVKRGAGGTRPNTLADVYGSAWITAGAGSVVLLYGDAGDPIVEFRHLKQPAAEVGPYRVIHDHLSGSTDIFHAADLLQLAQACGARGIEAKNAACALFETDRPSAPQVEKARRKLEALTREGHLHRVGETGRTGTPASYVRAATESDIKGHVLGSRPENPRDPHEGPTEVTPDQETAGQTGHGQGHGGHGPGGHVSAPPFKGGRNEPDPPPLDLDKLIGTPCPACGARAGHDTNCPDQEPPDGWS